MQSRYRFVMPDKGIPPEIILVIAYWKFPRAPSLLELQQPFVFVLGPAEAEPRTADPAAPPYGFPHDEVVRPKMPVPLV
jgi:hypothetical protein